MFVIGGNHTSSSPDTLWLHRSPKSQNKMTFLKTNQDLYTLATVVYSLLVGASVMELMILL